MVTSAAPWDNRHMDELPTATPPPPESDAAARLLDPRPSWWLVALRWIGWAVAVVALPVGMLVGWVGRWIGNCKLGFFGEYGALTDASAVTWNDLALVGVAWCICTVPWLLVAWRARSAQARTIGRAVAAIATVSVVVVLLLPQLTMTQASWQSYCM